jgi:hypothetical protein
VLDGGLAAAVLSGDTAGVAGSVCVLSERTGFFERSQAARARGTRMTERARRYAFIGPIFLPP